MIWSGLRSMIGGVIQKKEVPNIDPEENEYRLQRQGLGDYLQGSKG